MKRRGIDHEQYRRIQNDIDYVTRLFNRLFNLCKDAYRILDTQQRVIALINLPSFIHEVKSQKHAQPLRFENLLVRRLSFRYKENVPLALNIMPARNVVGSTAADDGTVKFERGKTYAIVGQNRSGKSTLVQLLCKLYAVDDASSDITLNGQSFSRVPRTLLRQSISYIPQRPFIFPGTIEENIRVGNNTASIDEVEAAAESAGVFFAEKPKPLAVAAARSASELAAAGGSPVKPWQRSRLKDFILAAASYGWKVTQDLLHPEKRINPFSSETRVASINERAILRSSIAPDRLKKAKADSELKLVSSSHSMIQAELPVNAVDNAAVHPVLLMETAERGENLSGGFAQSVALARVFLRRDAQIVILDEAMGQMDAIKKREFIFPNLFAFCRAHGMTLIVITHDVAAVGPLVDHVYVMEKGKVVQQGSHEELVSKKAEQYMRLAGL